MASLTCPLCCNQTFSSHRSLKYHLLSMVENIRCPSCNERCGDVSDLATHLEAECVNFNQAEEDSEMNTVLDNGLQTNEFQAISNSKNAKEVRDHKVDKLQTGRNAKAAPQDENKKGVSQEVHSELNMIYTCEMCEMTFESVEEHLAEYHEGEEVVVETEESEQVEQKDQDFGQCEEDDIFDEFLNDSPEGIDPAHTEARKEADGKVASNGPGDIEPVTVKFVVVRDGSACQITEEESKKVIDKSKIIEVHNCPNCKLQFPNLSHFRKHNCNYSKIPKREQERCDIKKIKDELRYQCAFCFAIYSSLVALNDHMKFHLISDDSGMVEKKTITMSLHVCNVCNTKFPTYKQLRLHSRIHDPIKTKEVEPPVSYNLMGQNIASSQQGEGERESFDCMICGKSYDKEYEEIHMKFHEEGEKFICLVCNRKFESKDSLDMHTKAHANTKKFACSYCKKQFNAYEALEEHAAAHCHERDFECQYCGRRFARPHEKVKHERIHTGEKPHVCQVCGKAFRVAYCLTLHMRTHSGTRPYTCKECGKRFKSHSVFNHHRKTHSEDRNYKCPYCLKAFKTAVQLAGHKNSHTKPFSCKQCNRPFASLYAVRAHMETHKRQNNLKFMCLICGAYYARSFALKDHMLKVHSESYSAGNSQDEKAVMELEGVEAQAGEGENQTVFEENQQEYLLEENHVQVLEEEVDEEGYVVHIQDVDASQTLLDDSQMEVVEA